MKPANLTTASWLKYNTLFLLEHFLGEKLYNKLFGKVEKKLYARIDNELSGKERTEPIKYIDLNPGEYTEPFTHPQLPVIFRGAAKDWKAIKKWDFDFFAKNYGDLEVILLNRPGLVKDSRQQDDVISFADYIQGMKEGRKEYLKFSRVLEDQSELIGDLDHKWLRKFRSKGARNDTFFFFMGGKGTITPLHDGFAQTIFIQIKGTKKWTFYKTHDRLFFEARPRGFNYFYSDTDFNDKSKVLLKYVQPVDIYTHEGDVLFFPSLVWHQVENVTDTIGVAYKFADFFAGWATSKMLTTCMVLAYKPPLIFSLFPFLGDTYNYKRKGSLMKKFKKIEEPEEVGV